MCPVDTVKAWLCSGAVLVCVAVASAAFAATGETAPDQQIRPRPAAAEQGATKRLRPPARVAIEACTGKREGDACSFLSARGLLAGECRMGAEEIFACRPHRNRQEESSLQEPPPPRADAPPPQPIASPPPQPADTAPLQPSAPAVRGQDHLAGHAECVALGLTAVLFASGLTWYGFRRHSTLPLRRLRKVTQQLARGELSARVGEGLVHRTNEVADLARDVDRMAERIEGLVSSHQRLIRDVSHELRSPLARLNVALELARKSTGSEHAAPFDRIERESDRLNELIGQLLMLTRLESESAMGQRADLDLAALVAEVAQDADFEARSHERRVVAADSGPFLLNGSEELLRQALENLVRNAVRYTATGTAVEISLRKKVSGGRDWAHIEVRDRGPGVPEAELRDIFRPFYRVNDARDRQSGGTGVGLAISERAVRLHGGSLRAFNAPGGGLIMEMELPLG